MIRATTLLRVNNWTQDRVAREVGYANSFAFSAAFHRILGLPPGTYRRRGKDKQPAARFIPA